MRPRAVIATIAGAAAVVVAARAIVYAFAPSPTLVAEELRQRAGGPAVADAVLAAAALIVALAVCALWLTTMAVQERAALERRRVVPQPPIRLATVVARASVLFVAAAPAFALVESYEHWRAGLGWHGLHCLTGPVHRDALPVLAALSLLAAALRSALAHALAWAQRTAVALAGRVPASSAATYATAVAEVTRPRRSRTQAQPRAPPLLVVSVPLH